MPTVPLPLTLACVRAVLFCTVASANVPAADAQSTARLPLQSPGPVEARSSEKLGNVFGLHVLSDGRVFVNDAIRRQLLIFDSTLTSASVVSGGVGAPNQYGDNSVALLPFRGDSTLILDGGSLGFLVYDPNGKVARVMAAPKSSDVMTIIAYTGVAALDSKWRLIYRSVLPPRPPPPPGSPNALVGPPPIDSAPVVRADFETRQVDTIGMVGIPVTKYRTETTRGTEAAPNGRVVRIPIYNPLQSSDNWAVLADGTVAFVRALDYHIDWVRLDGSRYSTPKMPFDWRRYTDEEKQGLIDAMRARIEKNYRDRMAAPGATQTPMPKHEFVPVEEIPNYPPTVRAASILADRDGNVWIPPSTSNDAAPGSLVYDVVNVRGEVTRRVQLPAGRTLVGFGSGGALYFTMSDSTGTHLERAHLR